MRIADGGFCEATRTISSVEMRLCERRKPPPDCMSSAGNASGNRLHARSIQLLRYRRTAPCRHVRRVMTQAYAENGHGIGCISAVNVIPHRSVSAALKR